MFQHRLNPRLWQGDRLRVPVRLKLLKTALSFYQFLDLRRLIVSDIILTGSNAAFNYTPLSDVDVHLIVDFARTACPSLAENFFTTKKALWNQTYHISIHGLPVELYVENTAEPVTANGIFSILHNRWLRRPVAKPPQSDDTAVMQKARAYADEIDGLLAGNPAPREVKELLDRLRTLRQNGLMDGGEFSVENLAFKMLRSQGFLQRLHDEIIRLRDRDLSL
jgi:predicted nucleotidyltransferase